MNDEKLDTILDHLYGELEPEAEDEFLQNVSASKSLSNRLNETRRLLTAYRLSPSMEIPDNSAVEALIQLKINKAREEERKAQLIAETESDNSVPETTAQEEPAQDSEPPVTTTSEPEIPSYPVNNQNSRRRLSIISFAAIIVIGIGAGIIIFNSVSDSPSTPQKDKITQELTLTLTDSDQPSPTSEAKRSLEPAPAPALSQPESTPPEIIPHNSTENEIEDILEEIDEISLSVDDDDYPDVVKSDEIILDGSDSDLLELSSIAPEDNDEIEFPPIDEDITMISEKLTDDSPSTLPEISGIDERSTVIEDFITEIEPSPSQSTTTPVTDNEEEQHLAEKELKKEEERLAEIERKKEEERLAEIERKKEEQRLAEIERKNEEQRLAEIERKKEEERLAEIERKNEEERLAEIERKKEEEHLAEIELKKEEQRLAEIEHKKEEQRLAEIKLKKEEQRLAEIERKKEEERLAEIERKKEEERLAEIERKKEEEEHLAEIERKQEEEHLAEIERKKEEDRLAEANNEITIVEPILLKDGEKINSIDDSPAMALKEDSASPVAEKIISTVKQEEKLEFLISDTAEDLVRKSDALYLKRSYLQALFGVEEALTRATTTDEKIAALILKARIELKLKSFSDMKKTIATLRPLSPVEASALQVLYNAGISHTRAENRRETEAATQEPEVIYSTPTTERTIITTPESPMTTPTTKKPKKRTFNPTTDSYYKRK